MKAYWHTKTLFLRACKYSWSYKHEHCTECGTCDFKHKWNGLCTSCYDKKRAKKLDRKLWNRERQLKYMRTSEVFREYQRKRKREEYSKYGEAISVLRKWDRWKKSGKKVIEINIKWRYYALPLSQIHKPEWHTEDEKMEQYKEDSRIFESILEYINSKSKGLIKK